MPRGSDGSYNLPAGTLVSAGDTILPAQHNPAMSDIAGALSGSLSRDGLGAMRAPLDLGSYKAINVAPGTNPTDGVNVAQLGAAGAPVGGIMDYAGSSAPAGWLLCFGQAVSRTTYAALFAAISTTYGAGDGTTTFNVPDLRGRVSAGKDDMGGTSAARLNSQTSTTLGTAFGEQTHALTTAEMPTHTHPVNDPGHSHGYTGPLAVGSGVSSGGNLQSVATGTEPNVTGVTIGNSGLSGAHNNIQPTMILNKIIRSGV